MYRSLPVVLTWLLVLAVCPIGGAFANGVTDVSISPASQTVPAAQTFTVNVAVDPTVPIAGVQLDLTFDPSLLTVNSVTEGNLLNQGGALTVFADGTIDNVAGTVTNVWGAILQQGGSVSTPGVFATFHCTAMAAPGTSLLTLIDVIVGDTEAKGVPVNLAGGSVTVQVLYTLTAQAVPAEGGTVTGGGAYASGTQVQVTATPANDCWHFVNWTGPVADPNSASTTVYVDGNKAIAANFALYQYTLTADASPPEGGSVTGGGTYDCGTDAAIAATPSDGYRFANWTGDAADPNSPSTAVHVDADKAVTANFAQCLDWDVNCDGCVDVLDVVVIGQHMDETGEPGWIRADANRDGLISVLDIVIVGQHFGEGCDQG